LACSGVSSTSRISMAAVRYGATNRFTCPPFAVAAIHINLLLIDLAV
jgi:hypothetical protein